MTNVEQKQTLSKRDESPASFRYVRTWSTMAGYAAAVLVWVIGAIIHNEVNSTYQNWVYPAMGIALYGCFHVPAILRKEGSEE